MSKYKIVALFGESASGKTSLAKKIAAENDNFNFIVPATTRPARPGEMDGVDYHFVESMSLEDNMEIQTFNGWSYSCAPLKSLKENRYNIGAFSPAAIRSMLDNFHDDDSIHIIPIYIYAEPKTRLMRSVKRCSEKQEDLTEVCRRFLSDDKDFQDIDFPHYAVWNNGTKTDSVKHIYSILNV